VVMSDNRRLLNTRGEHETTKCLILNAKRPRETRGRRRSRVHSGSMLLSNYRWYDVTIHNDNNNLPGGVVVSWWWWCVHIRAVTTGYGTRSDGWQRVDSRDQLVYTGLPVAKRYQVKYNNLKS